MTDPNTPAAQARVPHPDDGKRDLPRHMRWQRVSMFEDVPVLRWWAKPFIRLARTRR